MTTAPVCGTSGNVYKVLINILTNDLKLDPKGTAAALEYVKKEIQPVKSEISAQSVSIALVTIWVITFITIFLLVTLLLWVCYILKVPAWLTILALCTVIFVVLFIGYIAVYTTLKTVDTIVEDSVNQLVDINNAQTRTLLNATLNSAAKQYLVAIGKPCPP